MDVKVKVLAVVVILVAVSAVGVIALNGNHTSRSYAIDAGLEVYGNANGDYTIDSKDVDLIEKIIAGEESFSAYPLADANYDGKIDQNDVELTKKIINKESCKVYHVNTCSTGNYVVDTQWPCKSAIATGAANMLLLLTMADVKEMVHGICYSTSSPPDSTLFPTFSNMKCIGTSSTKISIDAAADVIKDNKVTVLISDKTASTISNEKEFEAMGVDVVRVAPALVDSDDACSQLLLIGFLFGTSTKCMEIAEWQTNLMKEIDEKLKGVEKVSVVTFNGSTAKGAWISAGTSDYKDVMIAAGGEYALDDKVLTEYSSGAYFADGDTWLYNYDFDYIIGIRTNGWYSGDIDVDKKFNESMEYLTHTKAYENGNAYIMVGDGPIPIRIAYAASIMYPEIFTEKWADSINKEFFDKYYSEEINFTDLFFVISPDMVSS